MSLFADHITSQDDIVLDRYYFHPVPDYKGVDVLIEKQPEFNYNKKVFIPLDIVWKYYVHEGLDAIVKMFGIKDKPDKNDFVIFAKNFNRPNIEKLIFKQETYINRSILHPIFDAFNEYWCFKILQHRNEETYEF